MDDESISAAPLPEGEPHKGHGFSWYCGWFFLVLLLYVLSTGPEFRLTRTKPGPARFLLLFYTPLLAASDACHPLDTSP